MDTYTVGDYGLICIGWSVVMCYLIAIIFPTA